MGPFGIAAVGLLANKGSGTRHKQSKARDAKGSSRSSNAISPVDGHSLTDGLADAASRGICEQTPSSSVAERTFKTTPGLSVAERIIRTSVKPGKTPSQAEFYDSFAKDAILLAAKQNEVSKALSPRLLASVLKKESLKDSGKPLVSGLNHIKTRAPSDSVRTVDSALDTSESSPSSSVDLIGGASPNNLRRQLKQVPGRSEHTPIKLRRSGRIRPDMADTLLLDVQNLSVEGGIESSHHGETSSYVQTIENVGSFTSISSEGDQLEMQEQLSSSTSVSSSIQSSISIRGSVPSNSNSVLTTSKGLAVDMSGTETTLSGTSVETLGMYDKKETDSPRFNALLRLTCGLSTKKTSVDITSFSHELSSTVGTSNPYSRFQNLKNSEAIVDALQTRFCSAKEQVNSELAIFGADLIDIMEAEESKQDKDCQAKQEDLLVLARDCSLMSVSEFREQCEGIVQKLEEERQLLPLGRLKQLHTRLLFILTTCTRLLQYQKESGAPKDGMNKYKSGVLDNVSRTSVSKIGLAKKFYSQEQRVIDWTNKSLSPFQTMGTESLQTMSEKKTGSKVDVNISKPPLAEKVNSRSSSSSDKGSCAASLLPPMIEESMNDPKRKKKEPLQETERLEREEFIKNEESLTPGCRKRKSDDVQHVICRICEDKVPTFCLEEHSHICALAVQCDVKGVSVDNRLCKLALIMDKLIESRAPSSGLFLQGGSPDKFKSCAFNQVVSPNGSKRFNEAERKEDELLDDPEAGTEVLSFKSLFGSKSENSRASSSVGSITPKSPLINGSYFDVNLDDRVSLGESEDPLQIGELADIARCVASTNASEVGALQYLVSCSKDLQNLLHQSKDEALTIHTIGKRIEKLLRAKYMEVCEVLNASRAAKCAAGENTFVQESPSQFLRQAPPAHSPYKDRTCIDDFEIIKPISRGAFGRVCLAKKRTTGDLFAIKVLRKADMIRKNAVESILAERDILISTRNPFVVRFFYSFTCSENLYLVMEYLIGGDLYSLLRNVGCLDETISQIYIAELVLALEYLHSLGVVHRDLKPDNLLIAHDGHLKLTDFGLSKVGLINSTDDLSRPCSSGNLLPNGDTGTLQTGSMQSQLREKRQKHSAVGTPDYLAPEILLGTGHGNSADWWSTGIILFECLTGVPPFNAEHPQRIFENILNRKIPWPQVPEDMSANAKDLIDKLLIEDPNTRLGANGAAEVKRHPFFKNINWDTLARQKAAFIPTPESPHDTSYFTSRHYWSGADGLASPLAESAQAQNLSDEEKRREKVDEQFDQPGDLVDFSSSPSSRFSFSNFSFKVKDTPF
ncbi:hypothetical protein GOP47_0007789 [Adiantum capillus-veneris]|uniref:non-specific serine/threonine protein kinase n=1 Tax=Adiantum capillus-veneris TaxID=13818 RepID=A0A9D4ZMB7_ADICA|nr:hypothetical protein GOP47_0007789 [Adiantum capillus-veneris]